MPAADFAVAGEAAFFALADFLPFSVVFLPGVNLRTLATVAVVVGNLVFNSAFLALVTFEAALPARFAAAPPLTLADAEVAGATFLGTLPSATTAVEPSLNYQSSLLPTIIP